MDLKESCMSFCVEIICLIIVGKWRQTKQERKPAQVLAV